MERAVNWISRQTVQFESNCTISCGEKEREREEDYTASPPVCLAFWLLAALYAVSHSHTHCTRTACHLARTFNDTHDCGGSSSACLPACAFLNAHLAGRICASSLSLCLSFPSLSLLFRSFARLLQFSIASASCLFIVYLCLFPFALFIFGGGISHDDQADNLIVSLALPFSLSLSLYLPFSVSSLIIMFFACKVQCQQRRASDKQREAETDRETGA